ncbi:MAG: phosphatase PAP2 family protein [Bacteroidales bacterium]
MFFLSNSVLFTKSFQDLDIALLKVIYENRITFFDPAFIIFTDTAGYFAFGFPLLALLISIFNKNKVLRHNAFKIVIPVAISAIVANILKYSYDLPRPYEIYPFIEKLSVGGSPSFPSGHTADAFAFAVGLSLIYPKWYIFIPSLLWATLIGYSRMVLGVHFPSDVLAGAIIGTVCTLICFWLGKRNIKVT